MCDGFLWGLWLIFLHSSKQQSQTTCKDEQPGDTKLVELPSNYTQLENLTSGVLSNRSWGGGERGLVQDILLSIYNTT